mgnify:FL=1
MYLVFYVCRQRRNRFNMDHMPKVFGVFMLGLFFLRSTGIFTKSCIVNVRQKITTSFRLIIRQQRYPQSNWLWIFNSENDYMKKIKYITAFCMMICIIMQLHTNVSANENNICYVAHRGYTKYAPENSIPAFEAAGKEGFQAVECDIHETAKNKKGKRRFVIMHDQTSVSYTHLTLPTNREV